MKRNTCFFRVKGFAFHILCELSQEYILTKLRSWEMFPVHFFRSTCFFCLPTLSSSPNWAIFVSLLRVVVSMSPADYKSSSTKPLFSYRAYCIQCNKLKLTHGVYFQTVHTLCVMKATFFISCLSGGLATRCTQALLMSWLMRTSIRKMHSWSMMASRGSGATEDCGTVGCQFYGQKTTHFHCRYDGCSNSI